MFYQKCKKVSLSKLVWQIVAAFYAIRRQIKEKGAKGTCPPRCQKSPFWLAYAVHYKFVQWN